MRLVILLQHVGTLCPFNSLQGLWVVLHVMDSGGPNSMSEEKKAALTTEEKAVLGFTVH